PAPRNPTPQLMHAAAALLAGLRQQAVQLSLTEADIALLAPAVAAWFERGASPAAVRHALTADLPHPLRFPAKLLRHRLTALLPAGRTLPATFRAEPLQNCDDCDRAFRAPEPGRCGECVHERALPAGDL
ncbi:helix-turn-helix domain-containing protein, partial [Streptomyces sp. AC154]